MDTVEFSAGEQMLSEFVGVLTDMIPGLDLRMIKDKFSQVMTKYHITRTPENVFHPDVEEKMKLFLSAKKLEGMSELTIDGYKRELIAFAEHVKKRVADITTADIRVFLASHDHVMMSTIAKKLFVLRSFFGWLTDEEIPGTQPRKLRRRRCQSCCRKPSILKDWKCFAKHARQNGSAHCSNSSTQPAAACQKSRN